MAEGSAADIRTFEGVLPPQAITGVQGALGIVTGAGAVKNHILEAAGAAALIVELLEIVLVKGRFLASLHGIGDVTLCGGAGFAAGDDQGAGGALVRPAAAAAVQGEAQGDAAGGEGLVRHEAQVAEVVVHIAVIAAVAEGSAADVGTGESDLLPGAVLGIQGALGIVAGAGAVKRHVFESAGTAAFVVNLLEIVLVKGNLLTGLYGVADVALGGGGLAGGVDHQRAGLTSVGFGAAAAVNGERQGYGAGEGLVGHEAQLVQIIVTVVTVTVIELGAAELSAGEIVLTGFAVAEVDVAVGIVGAVGTVELHIAEGTVAVLVEILLKVPATERHLVAGLHLIHDVALGGGGTALGDFQRQRTVNTVGSAVAACAVGSEGNFQRAGAGGRIRH